MNKTAIVLLFALLTACAPAQPLAEESAAKFPVENGVFTGTPQEFLLEQNDLGAEYAAADAGTETPNSAVIEGRADGEAYVEATGRIGGYRIQFNRASDGETPNYIINVVNVYESAEGAQLVLNRDWHQDVWSRIDNGELTQLAEIPGIDGQQLVWQDAAGNVGVEIVYRNLYIFLTGPSEGGDQYQFFADLANTYLARIQAGE
jgi:hypothetical protein